MGGVCVSIFTMKVNAGCQAACLVTWGRSVGPSSYLGPLLDCSRSSSFFSFSKSGVKYIHISVLEGAGISPPA